MSDIIERLQQVQGDNDEAREAAAEIERLRGQLAAAISINRRLVDEVERLRAEVQEWKERWAAERRDHDATIKTIDEAINERERL